MHVCVCVYVYVYIYETMGHGIGSKYLFSSTVTLQARVLGAS